MKSRYNGRRVSGGYEILESVTASEIFAEMWERDVTVRLNMSQLLQAPPLAEKGALPVNCQMQQLGLVCY